MQTGEIVKKDNYKRGYKVKRNENSWPYNDQDAGSSFGVILNHPNDLGECTVLWVDNHNLPIKKYVYNVGYMNQYDLLFAEDTVDYSLEDMFADLDALAERFE